MDPAAIVLEALLLTAIVVVSLTAYTYWAAKRGHDFSFLGPILFTSLVIVVMFGFVQVLLTPPSCHYKLENSFQFERSLIHVSQSRFKGYVIFLKGNTNLFWDPE